MPLKKLLKTFGFSDDLKKGCFPYLFNTVERINYKGKWPDKKFYNYQLLSPDEKKDFDYWYEKESKNEFDLERELKSYCEMDVDIIAKCVMHFRDVWISITKLDPFTRCLTIPMAVMENFRAHYLKKGDISIVPYNGYEPERKASFMGSIWLDFISEKGNFILTREVKIGPYIADGFDYVKNEAYEFLGCVFHGCRKCFPVKRWHFKNTFNSKTMDELYLALKEKIVFNRSQNIKVYLKWECDFKSEINSNKELKNFFDKKKFALKTSSHLPPLNPRDAFFGGLLPYRSKGKLLFPLCRTCADNRLNEECKHIDKERCLVGTWVSDEIKVAISCGYQDVEIYEVWHFEKLAQQSGGEDGLFSKFMSDCLKIKIENSGWPKNIMTETGKIKVNAFWGKFGQNSNNRCSYLIRDPAEFFDLLANPSIIHEQRNEFIVDPSHSSIIIACYTTALASLHLYTILETLQHRVLYFDTDSEGQKIIRWKLKKGDKIHYECKVKGITLDFSTKKMINFETVREVTFLDWPMSEPTGSQMAEAGFYYNGYSNYAFCFSCGVKWSNSSRFIKKPMELHELLNTNCPFVTAPDFSIPKTQNVTCIQNAPASAFRPTEEHEIDVSDASLVFPDDYLFFGDNVQCAFCYVVIFNWTENEVDEAHRKAYPSSKFIGGEEVGNIPIQRNERNEENIVRDINCVVCLSHVRSWLFHPCPLGSGKTMLVREIIRNFSNITTLKKKVMKVIWCYGQDQKKYEIPITLREISVNCLEGNIKLNPKLKTRLQKHKKIIRALANEKKRSKPQRIANQIGGILPFLIPAAATTLESVENWLNKQPAYALNHQIRKKFARNRIFVTRIDELWQCDLVDLQQYHKENSGYKFILTIIDVFSKYAWALPLKKKKAKNIILAFEKKEVEQKHAIPKFKEGDNVRIVEVQNVFEKGYMQKWMDEVLKIYQVIERPQATMYGLIDFENTLIKRFYENELQKVGILRHSKVFIRGFYGLPLSLDVEITLEKCNTKDEEEIVSYINYEVEKAMSRIKHKKDRTKLKAPKLLYKKRTKKFSMQSGEIVDILRFHKISYFGFSARFNEKLKGDPEASAPGKYLETLKYCISPKINNPYIGYYQNQIGDEIPGFRGIRRQRGYKWLSNLFLNAILPLFKTIKNVDASKGLKVLQDIAKAPGSKVGKTIVDDIAKIGATAAAAIESSQIIEFVIPSTENEYIYLDDSLLDLKAQIQIPNAINLNEWDKICPKQVTLSPHTYSFRSYFDTIFNYGKNAQKSCLTSDCLDEDEVMDVAVDKDIQKAILGGCTLKLRLQLNDPSFFFIRESTFTTTPQLKIIDYSYYVSREKITNDLLAAHSQSLKLSPARYPITRNEVKAMTKPSNLSNVFLDNIIIGRVPNKIYLASVENKAYLGDYNYNPYNFKQFKVGYIACYVIDVQYPNLAYQPDFENNLCVKEYLDFINVANKLDSINTLPISIKNYASENIIFAFHLNADHSDGYDKSGHINIPKEGIFQLAVLQGKIATDFGDFYFVKLEKGKNEFFSSKEFKLLVCTLAEAKDKRLQCENKVIVVASAKCSCCKYLVRNDFGIHKYDLVITPEERSEILKLYKDEEPTKMMFESEQDLAKAGFYFLNDGDRVKCHYCKGVIYKWEPGDKPLEEHKRYFPFCSYLKLLGCNGETTS
ncbi:uncharacterized protein B4U79_05370 [Dinothrombium tinctorium]|uniref:DNA-directed DNA polymerase n=1 Tax=Dinothrombium tinctorium TaxID=1965070 RepID=A0A443QY95_9ACAR|nr:uncharacterized protein B4U79_05370 [Dinothrombium tinctorium]